MREDIVDKGKCLTKVTPSPFVSLDLVTKVETETSTSVGARGQRYLVTSCLEEFLLTRRGTDGSLHHGYGHC